MSCFKKKFKSIFASYYNLKMSVIYILLTVSIVVAVVFFIAFIIAVKKGQYDDSYTPSVRMLFDDELVDNNPEPNKTKQS